MGKKKEKIQLVNELFKDSSNIVDIINFESNDLVFVLWWDTKQDPGWVTREEALKKKSPICASVGFYIGQDDESLKISPTICVNDNDCDSLIIPKGCIMQIFNVQKKKIRDIWKRLK
jgi:hypothetical protein